MNDLRDLKDLKNWTIVMVIIFVLFLTGLTIRDTLITLEEMQKSIKLAEIRAHKCKCLCDMVVEPEGGRECQP